MLRIAVSAGGPTFYTISFILVVVVIIIIIMLFVYLITPIVTFSLTIYSVA